MSEPWTEEDTTLKLSSFYRIILYINNINKWLTTLAFLSRDPDAINLSFGETASDWISLSWAFCVSFDCNGRTVWCDSPVCGNDHSLIVKSRLPLTRNDEDSLKCNNTRSQKATETTTKCKTVKWLDNYSTTMTEQWTLYTTAAEMCHN